MIYIDFVAGSHGNYLEFVCNKLLANVDCSDTPFNAAGASHAAGYKSKIAFQCSHYFHKDTPITNSKIISIQFNKDDLLPLSNISLLRAGDYGLDNDKLEINTYNKLNNQHYQWMLDNLIEKFSLNQICESYNAVKDSSWPDVNSLADFSNLPASIKQECLEQHNLHLVEISASNPDCPRWVLREFFKLGFKSPESSGLMVEQNRMNYDSSNNMFYFPYGCFYDLDWFKKELMAIAMWANLDYQDPTALHQKFMSQQPYANDKKFCDSILERIYCKESFEFPTLDLMKESYIAAHLELYYDRELPLCYNQWFTNSDQILDLFVDYV